MNAKMPELKRAFEAAGFEDVRTVLSSGNVVFGARAAKLETLERRCEEAMEKALKKGFATIVRELSALEEMLDEDPFARFELPEGAKRVVTFLREVPDQKLRLPLTLEDARILAMKGQEAFTAYVPSEKGPLFMTLIEKTFGKDVTTRTWDTVRKIVKAG